MRLCRKKYQSKKFQKGWIYIQNAMKRFLFCTLTVVLMLFVLASCFSQDHDYDGPCDDVCNDCNIVTREPEADHTFADCEDTECDVCGATREPVEHTYAAPCAPACSVCGKARENAAEHVYDTACDATCNVCGTERVASEHVYANGCDTDCNFCGALRVIYHTYTNDCDTTCNTCGAFRIANAHVYANDCDTTCDVCGALRMASNHRYTADCDASCNICGELRNAVAHAFDNACDDVCNVCGETRTVPAHVYDHDCDTDCNACGATRENVHAYGEWQTKTAATCDAAAVEARICSVCGDEETRDGLGALGHVYDNDCDTACNRAKCNHKRDINHEYLTDYVVKIEISCTASEVLHRFCNICGFEDTIVGREATGHAFDHACDTACNNAGCDYVRVIVHAFGDWSTKVPEGCLNDETEHRVCGVCGAEETRVGTLAHGHKYDNTCDTECNVCFAIREIEHTYDDNCDAICNVCPFERIAPHTYDDFSDLICNGCGHNRDCTGHQPHASDCTKCWICNATIEGAAHDFNDWATKTPATCLNAEVLFRGCKNCTTVETKEGAAALDHDYAFACDATCEREGCDYVRDVSALHTFDNACDTTCNLVECGYVRTVEHDFEGVDWATKTPASCAAAEVQFRKCNVCKAEETRTYGEPLKHAYDNACDTDCNLCGSVREITHDWGEFVEKTPATCFDAQILHKICGVCSVEGEVTEGAAALGHEYATNCDEYCIRNCGEAGKRVAPHTFTDEYDVTCQDCDHVRACAHHNAENASAADCTVCKHCGEIIPGTAHEYQNLCDTTCENCEFIRTVGDHSPSAADCTVCQYCGATIEGAAHVGQDDDCTQCKNCDSATGNVHEADPNNCVVCKNCGSASGESHTPDYENNCTNCVDCGNKTGISHKDADNDGKCDNCPKETLPGENWFPWAPL